MYHSESFARVGFGMFSFLSLCFFFLLSLRSLFLLRSCVAELEKAGKPYDVVITRHGSNAVLIMSDALEKLETRKCQQSKPATPTPAAAATTTNTAGTTPPAAGTGTTTTTTAPVTDAKAAAAAEEKEAEARLQRVRQQATQQLTDAYMRAFIKGAEEKFEYLVRRCFCFAVCYCCYWLVAYVVRAGCDAVPAD